MPCQAGESSSMSLVLGYLLDLVSPRQECAFAALAILKDRELRAVQSLQLRAIKHGAHLAIGNAHPAARERRDLRRAWRGRNLSIASMSTAITPCIRYGHCGSRIERAEAPFVL